MSPFEYRVGDLVNLESGFALTMRFYKLNKISLSCLSVEVEASNRANKKIPTAALLPAF